MNSRLEQVYSEKHCIEKELQELKKNEQPRCHNLQESSVPSADIPKDLTCHPKVDLEKEQLRLQVQEHMHIIEGFKKQVQFLTGVNQTLAEGILQNSEFFDWTAYSNSYGKSYGNW